MHNIEPCTKWSYRENIPEERLITGLTDKTRIIQEFVFGKRVTLVHVIANPDPHLYPKISLPAESSEAIGVPTIIPGKAAVIIIDIATKSTGIELASIDRFSGSLLATGRLADVKSSTTGAVTTLQTILGFTPAPLTRTWRRA